LLKQKPLLDFTKTNEEVELVKCVENSILVGNLENLNSLVNVVAKWRMYIGLPKEDISEELSIIADFLHKQYQFLTIAEIELAYTLSVTNKLKDVEFYGSFSPLYVGKVLDSFLYYRKLTLADTIRRKQKHDNEIKEMENRPTPDKQCNDLKGTIKDMYEEYKEKGQLRDPFNICYNFFRRTNMLVVKKDEIEMAMDYGRKQYLSKERNLFEKVNESSKEAEIQRYARNWCVQKYFDSVGINIILNNIKVEHFT
jgi:hypothetical protein